MKTAVLGTGIMGHGIAIVLAGAGHEVILWGHNREHLDNGMAMIRERLQKMLERGMLTEEGKELAFSRIKPTLALEDIKDSEFIIEAVVEKLEAKQELFGKLGKIAPKAVHATNTSSLSIAEIAKAGKTPQNVIGMHFFNPPYAMKLVEVVKGPKTSQETHEKTLKLAQGLGKTAVTVKDSPGFISNRLLMPFINDAIWLMHRGVAEKEGIDSVARLGFNHPMGPIELADFIGLDVVLDIMNAIYKKTKDARAKPCPLLVKKVKNGELGKKTGKGFYDYQKK